MADKNKSTTLLTGVLTAFAASLCCITPVLALIGGLGGAASSFSWLEPARPYLAGGTILVFGFAWYQKLKPRVDEIDCDCEEDERSSFWQSKSFLGIVTVIAGLLLAFPYYSGAFFPETKSTVEIVQGQNVMLATLSINGMTCAGCEHSVNYALNQTNGIIEGFSSFKSGTADIKFDKTIVSIEEISKAVEEFTGYEVTDYQIIN